MAKAEEPAPESYAWTDDQWKEFYRQYNEIVEKYPPTEWEIKWSFSASRSFGPKDGKQAPWED